MGQRGLPAGRMSLGRQGQESPQDLRIPHPALLDPPVEIEGMAQDRLQYLQIERRVVHDQRRTRVSLEEGRQRRPREEHPLLAIAGRGDDHRRDDLRVLVIDPRRFDIDRQEPLEDATLVRGPLLERTAMVTQLDLASGEVSRSRRGIGGEVHDSRHPRISFITSPALPAVHSVHRARTSPPVGNGTPRGLPR